ncbi:hypothetical protein SAMN05216358_0435 [Rhizobium sp. AN5]|uniref:hypothetical protein n=1 Tax=Rhizobium sp. AN5 TaxID=1855304 RepID=UPI000BDC0E46|nr:hypothetical protein [Rhizobium sp. AN5]SOC90378.1 hypothetical protein SAMN05216358_0435 [Rhizobium sp. AN5]
MARKDLSNSTRFWLDRSVPGLSLMQAALTTHEYKTTDCKHVLVLWNTEDERRHIRYLREDTALACYLQ